MFRMSKTFASSEFFKRFILICVGICLLFALTPFTDFDFDGSLDSLLTDGLLLIPVQLATIVPTLILASFLTAYLITPRTFSFLIVPPPVVF